MSDNVTPVNGIQVLINEVRALKSECNKIADNGKIQNEKIPMLESQIKRITLFQTWFPTAAITIAIIVRLIFLR